MIRCGLDRLLDEPLALRGRPYGLLSHAAAVSADLRTIVGALGESACGLPRRLFGPEHGFWGVEQDMVAAAGGRDTFFGIDTSSLYGDSEASLRPAVAAFDGLEVVVVDLVDVGARYYTYAATAVWTAQAALAAGVEVLVLDRPNPLGGIVVEGNRREAGLDSFIGAFEIPVRHGLTVGELHLLAASRGGWDRTGLEVVEVEGWEREAPKCTDGWRWRSPSPNIPTLTAAQVYPGACLVEATRLSEGRGTTRPFQLIGAPGLDGVEISRRMNALGLGGVHFLPARFRPQFQKHAGAVCDGVEIEITDPGSLCAYRMGVELLRTVHQVDPSSLEWRRQPYEFVTDRPAIDLLSGSRALRHCIDDGDDLEPWLDTWATDESSFRSECEPLLLYR